MIKSAYTRSGVSHKLLRQASSPGRVCQMMGRALATLGVVYGMMMCRRLPCLNHTRTSGRCTDLCHVFGRVACQPIHFFDLRTYLEPTFFLSMAFVDQGACRACLPLRVSLLQFRCCYESVDLPISGLHA